MWTNQNGEWVMYFIKKITIFDFKYLQFGQY